MHGTIEVFDIDNRWHEVVPHLQNPKVVRALDSGMTLWCWEQGSSWDPQQGPYYYSRGNDWNERALRALSLSQEHANLPWDEYDDGHNANFHDKWLQLASTFYPQPDTPDWYRCHGASHYLAGWNVTLGSLLYPQLTWHVLCSPGKAIAVGKGGDPVIFDVLWHACGRTQVDADRILKRIQEPAR